MHSNKDFVIPSVEKPSNDPERFESKAYGCSPSTGAGINSDCGITVFRRKDNFIFVFQNIQSCFKTIVPIYRHFLVVLFLVNHTKCGIKIIKRLTACRSHGR